jgi:hypothetical protein
MSVSSMFKKVFYVSAIAFAVIIILFLTAAFLRINVFNSTPF